MIENNEIIFPDIPNLEEQKETSGDWVKNVQKFVQQMKATQMTAVPLSKKIPRIETGMSKRKLENKEKKI
jgi:hypothetical protein